MEQQQQPLPSDRILRTPEAFRQAIINNMYYSRGANIQSASHYDGYMALSRTVRNHLIDRFRKTVDMRYATNPKFVYYLSAEYLLGRQLTQNLLYTDTGKLAEEALENTTMPLEHLITHDVEPGLGNGGLAVWQPAFWIHWRRWILLLWAMVSGMNTASSARNSTMATRWNSPTSGCSWTTRGSFPNRTT